MEYSVKEELTGRLLRLEELSIEAQEYVASEKDSIQRVSAFVKKSGKWVCLRCGSSFTEQQPNGPCLCENVACFYCSNCLQMGKIKKCSILYHIAEPTPSFSRRSDVPIVYTGDLSPLQQRISNELKQLVAKEGYICHLVWAVTGAGKTEMIFEAVQTCIQAGGRVAIACPRIDVCLELAPRLKVAFPTVDQVVLYGTSEMSYKRVPLTILTTHQLLRFRSAFDLLIIDEVDAFPYANSTMLQYGAQNALKTAGKFIYLTATPSQALQKKLADQTMTKTVLAARYHRQPLVVPERVWIGNWYAKIRRNTLPKKLKRWMEKQFATNKKFLLFIPKIDLLEPVGNIIAHTFPEKTFATVSSKEANRKKYVQQMRDGELDFLITTTILERGVTFFDTQVVVLGAENDIFTREVLVQIAGRVGRSPLAPTGNVTFFHYGQTTAMKKAIYEIKMMNHLAYKEGLLDDEMSVVFNE